MMLYYIAAMLISLTIVNRKISGSFLYPPALFSFIWCGFIVTLALSKNIFYPVSLETGYLYFLGAFSLSLGGGATLFFYRPKYSNFEADTYHLFSRKAIKWFIGILIIGFPFFLNNRQQISAASGIQDFWIGLRYQLLINAEVAQNGISIVDNLVTLAILTSLVSFYEGDKLGKTNAMLYSSMVIGLAYNLLNGTRSGMISLLLSVSGIYFIKNSKISIRKLIYLFIGLGGIFSLIAYLVKKGSVDVEASLFDNLGAIVDNFLLYFMGGLVGLDTIIQNPNEILANWHISRFFLETANKLGASFDIPSLHCENITVSPTLGQTNVYTIYFAYFPDFGWYGTALIMFILGAVFTFIYMRAREGRPHSTIMYGFIFSGMVLSCFNEQYLMNMNLIIKTLLFTMVLYEFPKIYKLYVRKVKILC